MEGFTTSDSDSCDSEQHALKTLDLSRAGLGAEEVDRHLQGCVRDEPKRAENVENLILSENRLLAVPACVKSFDNLRVLDVSGNRLKRLPEYLARCHLTSLIARNNGLRNDALPKSFSTSIKELNLSGNDLTDFPPQVLDMPSLKYLYLGGNKIESIPDDVIRVSGLTVLSLGGNRLNEVPESVGQLAWLQVLVLSDNQLESLPAAIANLKHLKSLLLHKNRLRTLPPEIVALKCLTELSLRDNPLVVRFVSDMTHNPPSLLELAARVTKQHNVPYTPADLPHSIVRYLSSAHHCVNPKCKGVFFDNRVEHIKFVDFCGKYRIPLLQYLCSSKCVAGFNASRRGLDRPDHQMMKKVLLG
ncbi:leucine-rich repeat-containing protein 58 [Frankliniella occidentalis]|uniref:Leucine-rich repeat protein soc-2 homolog n=2 Tax=Frankliniella occidentalis TaxID=133901 RepID=A0A6J1SI61_FRAOC|nr:leucine-rich repeat-containing protein 58 [Frankliniella occidentalis]